MHKAWRVVERPGEDLTGDPTTGSGAGRHSPGARCAVRGLAGEPGDQGRQCLGLGSRRCFTLRTATPAGGQRHVWQAPRLAREQEEWTCLLAVELAPELPESGQCLLDAVLVSSQRLRDAEQALGEALKRKPYDADMLATRASLRRNLRLRLAT